jgi:hypothetical protein
MQASKIFYPKQNISFSMQAIKKKIVHTSTFCSLWEPIACIKNINHHILKLFQ